MTHAAKVDRDREVALLRKLGAPTSADEMRALVTVPEKDNAAPLYRQAIASTVSFAGGPSLASEEAERRWVLANAKALDQLKLAAAKPACVFDRDWESGTLIRFPELASMKELVKHVARKAAMEAEAGRYESSMDWLGVGRAIARHTDEPILIGMLVSIACHSIVEAEFQRQVETFGASPAFRKAAAAFCQKPGPLPNFARGLAGEVLFVRESMDAVRTGVSSPDEIVGASGDSGMFALVRVPLVGYRVEAKLLHAYRVALESMAADQNSLASALTVGSAMDNTLTADRSWAGRIAAVFAPIFAQAGAACVALEAKRRMSRCALGLWSARATTGKFPDELGANSDCVDPFTGKPFGYQIDKGHVVLYSMGLNKKDEGGDRMRGGDDVPYAPTFWKAATTPSPR